MTDTRARGESPPGERPRGRTDDVTGGPSGADGGPTGEDGDPTTGGDSHDDRDGSPDSTEAGFRVRHSVIDRESVSFVRATVENPAPVDRQVRVENRLDSAVLPPRRDGVPEEGWNEDGFVGTVPAGGARTLGYACEAPPTHPPVAVSGSGRVDDADESDPSAADVVRKLGRAAPPGDAVPSAGGDTAAGEHASSTPDPEPSAPDPEPLPAADDGRPGAPRETTVEGESDGAVDGATVEEVNDGTVDAAAAEAWLDAVEARVELGERLTGASLATATDAVADAGGIDAVADLPETLATDAATLDAVAGRAARLAERARETDVPAEALGELA